MLLKNENNILPLSKDIKTIAVIGPNADNFESLIGNYNGIPKDPVTILTGINNKLTPGNENYLCGRIVILPKVFII